MSKKFESGAIVSTPGALDALAALQVNPAVVLTRHFRGDWGDLGVEDKAANDRAVKDGSRILSSYDFPAGYTVWVITDAEDDKGKRPATTILLPEDY